MRRLRAALAAAAFVVTLAACARTNPDDAYTGPAGRVFPPDARPAPRHRMPDPRPQNDALHAPSPGSRAPEPAAVSPPPAPVLVAAGPVPVAPTPAPARPAPVPPAPAPPPVAAAPPPTPHITERPVYRAEGEKFGSDLDLRIERLWLENGFTFAQLDVRNTSPYELEEITIKCTAFGKGHVNLDFREQTLLTRAEGRMLPGFRKSLKIRLERGGFDVREMSCNAKGW